MICVALALVPVGCQHVHYTATVIMVCAHASCTLAAYGGFCHLSSREGCSSDKYILFSYVIMDKHLHGPTRDGFLPKNTQASDALAAEYVAFEATMANVTSEHEAADVLHAATLEVVEEVERAQKDEGRLIIWTARAMIWAQQPKNFPTAGENTRPRALNFATPSGKFATDVQLME